MGMQVDQNVPAEGLDTVIKTVRNIWVQIPGWISNCTIATDIQFIDQVYRSLGAAIDACDRVQQTSTSVNDLKQYARDQYGDQNKDIVADYIDWRNKATECRDWAEANGTGSFTVGTPPPTVDATALAPLLTELETLSTS